MIKAVDYAVKNGASVINMRLGGAGYNSAMQEVINQAHAADVIICAASGYVVFRSTSANGTYTKLKKITSGDTVTYADTTVKAGKTYYYKVRSYRVVNNENVNSDFSAIVHKKAK